MCIPSSNQITGGLISLHTHGLHAILTAPNLHIQARRAFPLLDSGTAPKLDPCFSRFGLSYVLACEVLPERPKASPVCDNFSIPMAEDKLIGRISSRQSEGIAD